MLSEFFGAATRIRTGDLVLTKDALYQLSHSSAVSQLPCHYNKRKPFCQYLILKNFKKNIEKISFPYHSIRERFSLFKAQRWRWSSA